MRAHGIDHHRDARAIALSRRTCAIRQRDNRHELHKRRVTASGAAVKQVLASLSPVKAARIRHLDTIIKDVDGNRLSTEPIPVFSMDYGVGDCLAQNLLGNLKRVDTRDALTVEVRRKFLATAATASEIISPNVPSQIVRSMNLSDPAMPF